MKYIDSEKLIAEIELLLKRNEPYCGNAIADGQRQALYQMKDFITSLQQEQPEVDIEKEIDEHAINMPHGEFTHDSECEEHEEWAKREFRHFYELGLNARKG